MKSEKRRRRSFRNRIAVGSGSSAFICVAWFGMDFLTAGTRSVSILPLLIAVALLIIGSCVAFGFRGIRTIK